MKSTTQIFALILSLLMLFSLISCGGSEGEGEQTIRPTVTDEEGNVVTTPEPEETDPVFSDNELDALYTFELNGGYYTIVGYKGTAKEVQIPATYQDVTVTEIGNEVFKGKDITSVQFSSKLQSIGDYAFASTNLTEITIPENITYMGKGVFQNCEALTTVHYNAKDCKEGWNNYQLNKYFSSEKMDNAIFEEDIVGLFKGCTNLTTATFGTAVKTIPACLFYDCDGLTEITVPENIERIEYAAFLGCDALATLNYHAPNAEYYRGIRCTWTDSSHKQYSYEDVYVFDQTPLTTVNIIGDIQNVHESIFANCNSISTMKIKGMETILNGIIPASVSTVVLEDVKSIGRDAFANSLVSNITMSETLVYIGDRAFEGCLLLESIIVPKGVETIGTSAFSYCKSLESITISEGVTSIGDYAFSGCTLLQEVSIPSTLETLGKNVFDDCPLFEFNQHESSNYLGNEQNPYVYLYQYNGNSQTPSIHSDTKVIGRSAFYGANITSIQIPNGVTTIQDEAFCRCYELQTIQLPDSLRHIGENAFANADSLESLTIPNGVETILDRAFDECNKLKEVHFPESITTLGESIFSGGKLERVYITSMEAWCKITLQGLLDNYNSAQYDLYLNNQLVTHAIIPAGTDKIGAHTFSKIKSITEITIPASVTLIDDRAFYDCENLTKINFEGTKAEWLKLEKGSGWNNYTGDYIVHCSDGKIAK